MALFISFLIEYFFINLLSIYFFKYHKKFDLNENSDLTAKAFLLGSPIKDK